MNIIIISEHLVVYGRIGNKPENTVYSARLNFVSPDWTTFFLYFNDDCT